MNQVVVEWISKADEDWQVAKLLVSSGLESHGSICFHSQQCAEKLMKAILIQNEVVPPYTHDLLMLDKLLNRYESLWQVELNDLAVLTKYAVSSRYPGLEIDAEIAQDCLDCCDRIRSIALRILRVS